MTTKRKSAKESAEKEENESESNLSSKIAEELDSRKKRGRKTKSKSSAIDDGHLPEDQVTDPESVKSAHKRSDEALEDKLIDDPIDAIFKALESVLIRLTLKGVRRAKDYLLQLVMKQLRRLL
jgi:hypothetical protein